MRSGFPTDNYTPLGYLDNPGHTWKLHRAGLVRIVSPLRAVWHYPNVTHCSAALSLHVGLRMGNTTVVGGDWAHVGAEMVCPHHSKNLIVHHARLGFLELTAEFAMASAEVLEIACRLGNSSDKSLDAALVMLVSYFSGQDRAGLWQFGAAGRYLPSHGALMMRSFAEGPAFGVLPSLRPETVELTGPQGPWTDKLLLAWEGLVHGQLKPGENLCGALMEIPLALDPREKRVVECRVARGWSESEVLTVLRSRPAQRPCTIPAKRREDNAFWRRCPQLVGDWPAHWRHGWVYDWETLRMCVRQPAGIFRRPWDGMQVQKPRVVLAETALDMMMLSYAEPSLAKEVLLGAFTDALAPQVPCAREDGSTNMVAADGSECGTSPAWCFPFYCIESVFLRTGDRSWLRGLLPHLEGYLSWWLKNRCDGEGWGFYKCSWESGQDCSEKFRMAQPTGGELVEHLRPVDLQVGLYCSVDVLVRLRKALGLPAAHWSKERQRFVALVGQMWQGNWFCDFDRRSLEWVRPNGYWDITNLAPLLCGLASEEQVRLLQPRIRWYVDNPRYWLEWPSFFFMFAEILFRVGELEMAGGLIYQTADRVYRQWDRASWEPGTPLPGVSLECWGLDGPKGSEGYGWGATMPMHIIRGILGFRESPQRPGAFILSPALPEGMVPGAGRSLGVCNLRFWEYQFDLVYEDKGNGLLEVQLGFSGQSPVCAIRGADGQDLPFRVCRRGARETVCCMLRNYSTHVVDFGHPQEH
ncbi:MAG: hypothetical protein H5U38_03180 [Calditrichaeota bacterium]|nr:hypothetical protein [Calditrichota bacterium]